VTGGRLAVDGLLEALVNTFQVGELHAVVLEQGAVDEFLARRSSFWIDSQHELDYLPHVIGVVVWDPRKIPLAYSLEQLVHVLAVKRRLQSQHLVDHTPQ